MFKLKIHYINRETNKTEEEKVLGGVFLNWLYSNSLGMGLVERFFKKKIFSTLYGQLQDIPFSKRKIAKFVKEYDINMEDYARPIHEYSSFNDFFARELKEGARPIVSEGNRLASPADGRVLAYQNIVQDKVLQIKGSYFTLKDLLGSEELARTYDGGSYIVVRLCPTDYHRFHFPDEGTPQKTSLIEGDYYSVSPIALYRKPQLYCVNKRTLTVFQSRHFDEILYLEVGACCVGSIVQTYTPGKPVAKGQEKGYFKFGGSTVILLFKPGVIQLDADLLNNTEAGLETLVKMGTGLGTALFPDH